MRPRLPVPQRQPPGVGRRSLCSCSSTLGRRRRTARTLCSARLAAPECPSAARLPVPVWCSETATLCGSSILLLGPPRVQTASSSSSQPQPSPTRPLQLALTRLALPLALALVVVALVVTVVTALTRSRL